MLNIKKWKLTDNLSKDQRSKNMRNIRSKNTTPEIKVRKYLFNKGLRFRLHCSKLIGHPDIVLKKYKTVIFVNGCFWHGHQGCKYFKLPKTNENYWRNKLWNNINRDKNSYESLKLNGWRVSVIWECEMRNKNYEEFLNKLIFKILN